ncbi:UNVERIFIED_CONTAM: Helicase protein MOM1 [Sesamum radiatum]|uniref:Helicase protein MOM1 n=1 Tax=Sesamum radiatum TaxID=300843 RepID=A0AAW2KRW7_SESRA
MEVENMNTVQSWNKRNYNMNEKEATLEVHRVSKTKRLNGHSYKELLRSLAKKAKRSDLSIQRKKKLSQSEVHVTGPNSSNGYETTDIHSPSAHSQHKRVDFLLRRVRYSASNHVTKTKKRKNMLRNQCNLDMSKLEEKSAHSIANECKNNKTKFVEYWFPVRLSNVQIEQYCASLFSNAGLLCSSLKHDSTEFLHDILVSTRKWTNSTGDILDDIIHEKFGTDSFVRIGGGICRSKRQAALKTFNDKRSGRFVCLMETRACLPSINLASIDSVIFFNSDWDPMNDFKALQKINLDSQFEQVKVFRLYSLYTVEEKVLILSKQGMNPEGNLVNMKQSTCQGLLTWGASYLFKKLDEFHNLSTLDTHSVISSGDSFLEDVFLKLSTLLPNNENSDICKMNSFVLEVQLIGGTYPRNISLLGEVESMNNVSLVEEMVVKEPPHVFWANLLEGRNPTWKHFSNQSPRTRKGVQRSNDLHEESAGTETASKKCKTEVRKGACQIRYELQSQEIEGNLSGGKSYNPVHHKVKYISVEYDRREEVTLLVDQQSNAAASTKKHVTMRANASSAEPHSLLTPDEDENVPASPTRQQIETHAITGPHCEAHASENPLIEDSVRPLESSMQNSMGDVPLQTTCIASFDEDGRGSTATSYANVPLNSGNSQHPEASQLTHSEALQFVCKALQTELEGLQKEKTEILKKHEDMKLQTNMACEQEIDQIRKKYDVLLQNAEMALVIEKEVLETRYNKIYINKSLAEVMMLRNNSENAALSQAMTNCLVEDICRLIFQQPGSITVRRPEQESESLPIPSQLGCSVVQELNQALASKRIASRSNQSCPSPCVVIPNLVTSSEVVSFQPAMQSLRIANQPPHAVRPDQPLASPCTADPQFMSPVELNCSLPVQQPCGSNILPLLVKPTNAETILGPRNISAGQGMTGLSMNSISSIQIPQASLGLSTIQMPNMPITFSGFLQAGNGIRAPAPHFQHMKRPLPIAAPKLSSPSTGINFSPVNLQWVTSNAPTQQTSGRTSFSLSPPAGLHL